MGFFTFMKQNPETGKPYEFEPGPGKYFGADCSGPSQGKRNDGKITDAEVREVIDRFENQLNSPFNICGSVWVDYDRKRCTQPDEFVGEDLPSKTGHRKKIKLHLKEDFKTPLWAGLTQTEQVGRQVEVVVSWGERGTNEPEKILVSWPSGGDALPAIPSVKASTYPSGGQQIANLKKSLVQGWHSAVAFSDATGKNLGDTIFRTADSLVTSARVFAKNNFPPQLFPWG